MYSVFEQCLHTSKSKFQVQLHDSTMNAQLVYKGLLDVYEKDLSGELQAGDLRAELTVMRLDDKWKSSFETFLNHWSTKVLDLERTQDKSVDDDTKRIWLTNTLETQKQMKAAIDQAYVTESTMSGLAGTSVTKLPWDNFFSLVMNQAKLLDRQRKTASKGKREANSLKQKSSKSNHATTQKDGNGHTKKDENPKKEWKKYTGPEMVMTADMHFKRNDYYKLSSNQKRKLKEAKDNSIVSGNSHNTTI